MRNRTLLLCAVAITTGLALTGASSATAHPGAHASQVVASGQSGPAPSTGVAYLAADLSGGNEVPPADPDGRGRALVRIQGTQVCFTLAWAGIGTPSAGHIHVGAKGVNGPIVVGFFGAAMPDSVRAATGCVSSTADVVAAIRANPAGYYVNLHNAEFPGGAIRGQLRALRQGVDLLTPFRNGNLIALCDGGQEVPAADPDGHAVAFIRIHRSEVSYGVLFGNIAPPSAGHIHAGAVGINGPIVVGLFTSAVPPTIFGIAGTVPAAKDVTRPIAKHPANYYVNLHNADFPGGAVRGQLFRAG